MTQVLERNLTSDLELRRQALSLLSADKPRKFSFTEFEQMSDLEMFADQHLELLNGEITVKGMQSPRHAYAVQTLDETLKELLEKKATVAVQLPSVLLSPPPDFVEPDIALRIPPRSRYATENATSAETLLVIEISDSTLHRDQTDKLEAYARNEIPEYWIYNLHNNTLEVHQKPRDNLYTLSRVLHNGEAIEVFEQTLQWWV
jgi:Uma2 family endonuclease